LRAAAGRTPSDAIEAQKRKRLELEAAESGLEVSVPEQPGRMPLKNAVTAALPVESVYPITSTMYTLSGCGLRQLFELFLVRRREWAIERRLELFASTQARARGWFPLRPP
jgi:hypothetical protein